MTIAYPFFKFTDNPDQIFCSFVQRCHMKLKLWSANLRNLYNFDVTVISFMASEGEFTWSASLSQAVHHSESEIQSCSYQVGIP